MKKVANVWRRGCRAATLDLGVLVREEQLLLRDPRALLLHHHVVSSCRFYSHSPDRFPYCNCCLHADLLKRQHGGSRKNYEDTICRGKF
ncbi:hypothetical protein TNCV_5011042 [Trichonephila clavipes]|nr:hypothetical protein TNCV_5011042 [Trichonephila clavipes]